MAEYTTITVDANDTYSVSVGSGETFENYLIDISASGAAHDIQASGTNWAIRNVAIQGTMSGGHTEPFRARDTGSGTSVIENVYLGDGTTDGNATGIYVYWNHSGHIDFRNVYVGGWTDNGIYASGPGNPPSHSVSGHGGTVTFENCYSFDNSKSNLRAGTDGSEAVNCVMVDGHHRGYWGFYNDTELIDCDIVDSGSDIAISDSAWDDPATVTCTNSRWQTETAHGTQSTSQISGSPAGTPQDRIPSGCPTTAVEAASGSGTITEDFAVATRTAASVTHESARLRGDIDALETSNADVWFAYRPVGSSTWRTTPTQTVTSATGISADIAGLSQATQYEFRLEGEDSAGTTSTGSTQTFRTRGDTDPVNEDFSDGLTPYEGDTGRFSVVSDVTPGGS